MDAIFVGRMLRYAVGSMRRGLGIEHVKLVGFLGWVPLASCEDVLHSPLSFVIRHDPPALVRLGW